MLLHLRLTVPSDLTDDVLELLEHADRSANLTLTRGASISPRGDLVECDVARELAGEVMARLKDLGLHESGGILVTTPTSTPFAAARRLERVAPGDPDDAVVWDTVIEQCYAASRETVSYYLFFVLASLLAAIAVITDSSVLVVGAMVVGPEFGTVAAISTGLVFANHGLTWRATRLLLSGIVVSVVVVALLSLLAGLTGLVTAEEVTRPRPQTGFIWHPDRWSFIVAILAGAAGVLAMTTARANAMVGVFISVTTIPAVGNLALAIGVWAPSEISGSIAQLGVNLAGMVVAGVVVLVLQRLLWVRTLAAAQRLFTRGRGREGEDQRATR